MFRTTRCLSLALLGVALAAADPAVVELHDIRLGLGIGPQPDHLDTRLTSYPPSPSLVGAPDTTDYDSSPALSVTLGGVAGRLDPFGVVYGGELRYLNGEQRLVSTTRAGTTRTRQQLGDAFGAVVPDLSYSQIGGAALGGIGWAFTPTMHAEVLAILGLDYVTFENWGVLNSSLGAVQGQGWGHTLGARGGFYWTDPETSWQFGVEVEWSTTRVDLDFAFADGATTQGTLVNSGVSLRGVLGHRF